MGDKGLLRDTVMNKILGTKSGINVLDYLILHRNFDVNIMDIHKATNVGRKQVHEVISVFLAYKMLEKTRKIGVSQLYKLNKKDKKVKAMINFYNAVLNEL